MNAAKFPSARLAHLPTPRAPLPRPGALPGSPEIWSMRDDCNGLPPGGNKTRKLEYRMARALEQQTDFVLTQVATQSTPARQTATAAAEPDMYCQVPLDMLLGTGIGHSGACAVGLCSTAQS